MVDTIYGGSSPMPKGLKMEKFPRPKMYTNLRLGHPIRLTGFNGRRLRITSSPTKGCVHDV